MKRALALVFRQVLVAMLLFLTWGLGTATTIDYALDERHVGQDLVALVSRHSPQWASHAQTIVHWSAYYELSPLALLAALEVGAENQRWTNTISASKIHQLARSFAVDRRLPGNPELQDEVRLSARFDYFRRQLLPLVLDKSAGDPVMVAPIEANRPWHFNGAHTWTGDDNGAPMSSIDLLVDRGHQWGDDISDIWVASAHDGVVTRFSECFIRITHDSGWFTDYYHLENPQVASGDRVVAGQSIANYADDLQTALCQGGHSALPHVHFALGRDSQRVNLSLQTFNDYRVHPGRFSYDLAFDYMWINEGARRLRAWVDPISRIGAMAAKVDFHVNGMWYSPELAGHGLSLAVQPASESGQLAVFVALYTYDDQGQANFYTGNVVTATVWEFGQPLSVPMFQSANGGFSNPGNIDFDSADDFSTAGQAILTLSDCGEGQIDLQLTERTSGLSVEQRWPLSKLIGVPVEQCEAASGR